MARIAFEQFSGGQQVSRLEQKPREDVSVGKRPFSNRITEFLGLGGATKTFGNLLARQGISTDTEKAVTQEFVEKPTPGQVVGALGQTASVAGGLAFGGPASLAGKVGLGAGLGYAYDVGQDLIEKKGAVETLTPGLSTVIGGALPVVPASLGSLKKPANQVIEKVSENLVKPITSSSPTQAVKQTATDFVERVPRFVGRVGEDIKEQAIKAERIKASSPAIAEALKVDLPESFIQTIPNATPEAKKAFKRVLDITEKPKTTLGQKANPGIVSGELAAKQYEVIEKQKQTIGKMIGNEIEKLGKSNIKANMGPAFGQIDDVLAQNGIKVAKNGTLSSLKYTDKEMSIIQDLYNKSRKGGDVLTASEVRDLDHLFSKIQREARIEGIGDLRINANGQNMSMFRVFRDIYTNQLENIAPEIRPLNAKYRNLVTLTDDIEDSILKTPDFNVTKSTDPSEFAKVNLRRIFGEAQSSPAYEAIADEMDTIARQLGYADASPKEVAAFAQEIRQLYPETIPKAGFQGGIRESIGNLVGNIMEAGKANVTDQRKALRALIEATE